ncbi:fibronectin type III domain-containing protein [Hymenobacter sp. BT186]|uniref:Fibronectin type III domain-containing protein n=1 Tax=Hymenobacter telluris TaxID=2816474 RepID=A0A939ETP5_9BACT|nr:fibronectin type III domain-containing protein [Hymenobacter telluris]MBO0357047.1 fibronectin type III domain-containing protein [Hymenobacter telluris]MBW3373074.1 fibronectin type III domain-containing protein [Hymenobacter norwichensis]
MASRLHAISRQWRLWRTALVATLGIGLATASAQAQDVNTYTLTSSAGTYTPVTGGTALPDMLADTYITPTAIPLGFTFVFDGTPYTQVKASSDGFLSFNPAATSGFSTLAGASASNRPLVAPLGDDLDGRPTGATALASYQTTGTAPNRVFTFEWQNWEWRWNANVAVISFQAKLYEGTNRVEFVYRQEAGATNATATLGASIGLAGVGTGAGSYLSLSDASATPTASSTTENTNINTKPATGQVYAFLPGPTPSCPAPRNLAVSLVTSTTAPVSWTSVSTGNTYTVEYGPTGFTPGSAAGTRVPNITGTSYTITGLTPSTPYQVYVTQNCGTANGNSTQTGPVAFTTLALPPTNDDCANAVLLTTGATCTTTSGTVLAATQSLAASTCGTSTSPTTAADVWYRFVATGTSQVITATASFTPVLEVRSGTCATSASISCVAGTRLAVAGLTVGSTYFVRVYPSSNTAPTTPTFTICVVDAPNAPANDDCTTATALPALALTGGCNNVTGTNVGATSTQNAPAPGCASYNGSDVWYSFTVPANGSITVQTDSVGGSAITDTGLALYSGTCGNLTLITCDDDSSPNGNFSSITLTGRTAGEVLYARVWEFGGDAFGRFKICASYNPPAANDDCANSVLLTTGATCTATNGTLLGATQSLPASTCGTSTSPTSATDVWFRFVATASGQTISVNSSFTPVIELRSGTCASSASVSCVAGTQLAVSGLTVGTTYFVRVYNSTNTAPTTPTFTICVTNPPANDDCANSVLLTSGATCTPTNGTILGATQSLPAGTCGTGTPPTTAGDVWYRFVATASGQIIQTTASFTTAIEVRSGTCATSASVACGTGTRLAVSGLTVGSTYFVRIYNSSNFAPTTSTFTVCVSNAPNAPTNDDCVTATALPTLVAGAGCNYVTATNVGATDTQNVPAPGCASYNGGDVWYSFVVPAGGGGIITVQTDSISGSPVTDTGLALYSGTCGNLTLLSCDDDSSPNGLYSLLRLSGRTAGETIYIRAWEFGNDSFGRFKVCAAFDLAPANDEPAGAVTLTFAPDCVTPIQGSNTVGSTTTPNGYTNGGSGGCGTNSTPNDVWYRFTTAASGRGSTEATLTVTGAGSGILRLFTAPSAAGPFTAVTNGCSAAPSASAAVTGRSFTATGLTPSTTYYVQVSNYSSFDGGSAFTICLTAPSNCPIPAGPSATALTSNTATLGWAVGATTPSGTFTLEYGPRNFTLGNGTRITGITGLSTTLTGLTPDTEYCFYVRQECGAVSGNSAFSGPVCFRTNLAPSPNDEPCNATALTVGAAAVTANNIGATTTPLNGYSNPGCSTASAPKDVWFRFVATATTAQITVTGNPAGQVRLFSAGACAGPFTQIACQASTGANTAAGPLNATGLTIGTTYYVFVSGYGSSDFTGNFTIAVRTVLSTGNELAKGEVSVYPNPSHDGTLTLSLRGVDGVSSTQVELFNALGQRVLTQPVSIRGGAVEQPLAVQGLAKGIYTLRAQIGQTTITRKVVLE